nr:hypothetical protein [Tanacetum cinerariifolium]
MWCSEVMVEVMVAAPAVDGDEGGGGAWWRDSFASMLIEVDAAEGIFDNVEIWYKKFKGCNIRPLTDEEKAKRNAAKTHASTKALSFRSKVQVVLAMAREDRNEDYKRMKFGCDVEDEVGKDLSSYANFMTNNTVSNTVDASMADMKMKDPNKGILKKLDRVMGNSGFLDLFGSCYARFLPYVTSDHCPALLVITDNEPIKGYAMFVLAKRLKNMKRHLRDPNKKNRNVHEKVKMLRTKLKKVQVELDEERVLKQKAKVNWLTNSGHNSAYFHNTLKGRKNRSMIMCVQDDMGNEFHDEEVVERFVDHF